MPAQYHPPAEMLMDYASGALREAPSLVVATHLALCAECRSHVSTCEEIGGTLLNQSEAVAVSSNCRDAVMAALDAQQVPAPPKTGYDPFFCNVLPAPLRSYVGCNVAQVPWKKFSSTVDKINLDSCSCSAGRARLIRVKAGSSLPMHTHKGNEYTVVLSGVYHDGEKTFRRGDFDACDGTTTHAPVAGAHEDCVCLIVVDGDLQMTGLFGRIISPFIRF